MITGHDAYLELCSRVIDAHKDVLDPCLLVFIVQDFLQLVFIVEVIQLP